MDLNHYSGQALAISGLTDASGQILANIFGANFSQNFSFFQRNYKHSTDSKIESPLNFQGWPSAKIDFPGYDLAQYTNVQMGFFYLSKKTRMASVLATLVADL